MKTTFSAIFMKESPKRQKCGLKMTKCPENLFVEADLKLSDVSSRSFSPLTSIPTSSKQFLTYKRE
jgi:hypothetical protein